ncbi:hypothetical protein IFM89_000782 [Coptis chinensis]|uniref:NADP-dependent oxidoreductase domain-containing protein n=1 Tax=Coptis chinensis TaxID=261450 RepID=A0A835IXC7_9MAGN|nr:hypothetical protein IFM89_000782 [Coptis chinensis]
MEECQVLSLTKSIGVSNFSCKELEHILSISTIPPTVNQVEMSPVWQQNKLREFCQAKGIIVAAYSPLGAKGTSWGTNSVMDSEVLSEIAKAKGKTHAQVCVVVKSFNEERMQSNLQIFDWALSLEEHKLIGQIPQERSNATP